MTSKVDYLLDLIFRKLKNYKAKKIFLEKDNFKKYILSLFTEKWIREVIIENCYYKYEYVTKVLYSFSSLTIILISIFILSLYFLYKVTSNANK